MKLLALTLLVLTALFVSPAPAFCFYCYSGPCYSSQLCGGGCVCMRSSPTESGRCVSFNRAEESH
jgi:hypothetical protein